MPVNDRRMFGIIVSGRLVQTDFQQVSDTQFLFTMPDADAINHVVVFMTGQTPFPNGLGGAVYFSWPNPGGQTWQLLGELTNAKPSAIFKVSKLKSEDSSSSHPFGATTIQPNAQIGISVESLNQLSQQTPVTAVTPSNLESFVEFTTKMLENFVNYSASFAISQSQMTPNPHETFVPMSTLMKWYEDFQRKLKLDPYFWRL